MICLGRLDMVDIQVEQVRVRQRWPTAWKKQMDGATFRAAGMAKASKFLVPQNYLGDPIKIGTLLVPFLQVFLGKIHPLLGWYMKGWVIIKHQFPFHKVGKIRGGPGELGDFEKSENGRSFHTFACRSVFHFGVAFQAFGDPVCYKSWKLGAGW